MNELEKLGYREIGHTKPDCRRYSRGKISCPPEIIILDMRLKEAFKICGEFGKAAFTLDEMKGVIALLEEEK